jgi:hypothetical protein
LDVNTLTEAAMTIALAIVGLAIVSVLVSRKAQTPAVIQAAASGFNNSLATAEAPVTGAMAQPVLAYPSMGYGGLEDFSALTATPYG